VCNGMKVLALLAVTAITACRAQPQTPSVEPVFVPQTVVSTAPAHDAQGPVQGENRMTALNALLALFVSERGAQWPFYDSIAGVAWRDAQPVETPEVADPGARFSRSGTLTLVGFGDADLPDGKVGADAGVRRGNEGESGLTLSGDADRVNEVSVVKFYPSDDYESILQQQFAVGATLVPEADRCALNFGTKAGNTGKNKFYRIDIGAATLVHVEAFVDEDAGPSGPGATFFVFYRTKPEQRIAAMQCHAVQP
jgi:hypothetical protein